MTSRRDQQTYWAHPQRPWRYVSVPEFAEHFRSFSAGRDIAARLAKPFPSAPLPAHHARSGHEEARGPPSRGVQSCACILRLQPCMPCLAGHPRVTRW